jgi:hypothetical protein
MLIRKSRANKLKFQNLEQQELSTFFQPDKVVKNKDRDGKTLCILVVFVQRNHRLIPKKFKRT